MDKAIINLMFDLSSNKEVYDDICKRTISTKEANDVLRFSIKNLLGLGAKPTEREIKRALNSDKAKEFMAITEEILDQKIYTGFNESEFMNNFVELRSLVDGDVNEFITEKEVILSVAKVAGDHHDLTMQKLGNGSRFQVPISTYAVKVGTDIRLFITGRKDWNQWTDAVAKAFVNKVQTTIYGEFINVASKLPTTAGLKGTGALSTATKATFDGIVDKVAGLNQSDIAIIGTKSALRNLNNIGDVNWRADSQKESVASTGILSDYEGTPLMIIPQRYNNDSTFSAIIDDTKLFVMPLVSDESGKPVKAFDYGETILEVTEIGATMNDQQSYEAQRKMGFGTVLTRYFGEWDIDGQ